MLHADQIEMSGLDLGVPAVEAAVQQPAESPLSKEEVEDFRASLGQLREWLLQSIGELEARSTSRVFNRSVSLEDEDGSWEQAMTQQAVASKRAMLHEIMHAFERIRENTYGQCVADHRTIPRSLLQEVPWARYCAACASRDVV